MADAYIVEAVRTAGGRRGGRLAGVHPVDLAAKHGVAPTIHSAVLDVVLSLAGLGHRFLLLLDDIVEVGL